MSRSAWVNVLHSSLIYITSAITRLPSFCEGDGMFDTALSDTKELELYFLTLLGTPGTWKLCPYR